MTFVLPPSWLRSIHPRRGGVPVPYEPGAAPPRIPERAAAILALPDTPREAGEAGLLALRGGPGVTPLGVAALWAVVVRNEQEFRRPDRAGDVADHWVARHGLAFAARTAAEFAELKGPLGGDRRATDFTEHLLAPLRVALAAAADEDYAAAVDALRAARDSGSMDRRLVASFLAPTEAEWVRRDIAEMPARHRLGWLPLASVSTVDEALAVLDRYDAYEPWDLVEPRMMHTLAEAIGDGVLDVYAQAWTGRSVAYTMRGQPEFLQTMMATQPHIPTDRAFQTLVDQAEQRGVQAAIADAADRYPERAMRLLEASAGRPRVAELLRRHVAKHPDLAPPHLRPVSGPRPGEAPAGALPAVLADPPWVNRPKPAKPVVLDLHCPDEPAVSWPPGERERLLAKLTPASPHVDYAAYAEEIRAGDTWDWHAIKVFVEGPEDLALSVMDLYRPRRVSFGKWWLDRIAARFGVRAYPLVLNTVRADPATAPVLMPFTSPEIALLVADWLARLKSVRREAHAWLRAHPAEASRALIPAALGRAGVQRRPAGLALVALAGAGHRDAVLLAAKDYGAEAEAGVADLLDADPLVRQLPPRIPTPPEWADPVVLPAVRLRPAADGDSAGTLPAAAVNALLTMLMMSKAGEPYPGIALVRDACEPHDLARFGWEVLCRWEAADAPPAGGWALDAQAFLGDDQTAAGLAAAVRRWPYEGAHKRAAAGLDTLMHLGTEAALRELHDIATKVKAKAVRARAEANLTGVAEAIGLTAEALADRLVPHFGLAPDATMVLDYGPRKFVAGFDDQLKPYVADEDGTRRKDLPPTATRDDADLAAAAQARFTAAKKGVRKVATEQVRRLERAMAAGRRWTAPELRTVLLEHPLLWPLARRLVWITGAPGAQGTALRIAEDRTFADVTDAPCTLPADAVLGVAHPVDLDVPAWTELFADYDILQPFPQLRRKVHTLHPDESAAVRLTRFDDRRALTVKLLALDWRGWRRSGLEGAHQASMERDLPGGRLLVVNLDPGITLGLPNEHPDQHLADIWICPPDTNPWTTDRPLPFSSLDAASTSELLADLESTL
ncbi:DUF4132 domain-containing protein [Dactylosporangium sp. NPDC051541]|uniref:DUF4132 domain-containing protein n=1 Tax=Dactylosporangium sp. NPDC051541 TaxID=3363977 RepID=UPI0037A98C42